MEVRVRAAVQVEVEVEREEERQGCTYGVTYPSSSRNGKSPPSPPISLETITYVPLTTLPPYVSWFPRGESSGSHLKETATAVEGTFRVSGSAKRMKDLQAVFDSPPKVRFALRDLSFRVIARVFIPSADTLGLPFFLTLSLQLSLAAPARLRV